MRKMAPIKLVVYPPKTNEETELLSRRLSEIHAAVVLRRIKSLNCPAAQKLALLNAVIETAKIHAGKEPP